MRLRQVTALLACVLGIVACTSYTPPPSTSVPVWPAASMQVITGTDANHQVILAPLKQVIPNGADNSVQLAVSFADYEGVHLGIEGAILFINATSENGSVVLDRIVEPDGDLEGLPAGDYTLTAYYRPCDANCGFLDPPKEFCSVTQVLDTDRQYWLTVRISAHECAVAPVS